jgi:hypothetical protein
MRKLNFLSIYIINPPDTITLQKKMSSDDVDDDDGMRKFSEEQKKLEENAARMTHEIKTALESNNIVASFEKHHSPFGIRVLVGSLRFSCTAPFYEYGDYELAQTTILEDKKINIEIIGCYKTSNKLCAGLCAYVKMFAQ